VTSAPPAHLPAADDGGCQVSSSSSVPALSEWFGYAPDGSSSPSSSNSSSNLPVFDNVSLGFDMGESPLAPQFPFADAVGASELPYYLDLSPPALPTAPAPSLLPPIFECRGAKSLLEIMPAAFIWLNTYWVVRQVCLAT
jgi:hypothetical protein